MAHGSHSDQDRPAPGLRTIGRGDLAAALARSRTEVRRRANLNVHETLEDPIQRLFNVLQPGTYIRPHRHGPERWELFVILSGRAGVLVFDEQGKVTERTVLDPAGTRAVEIAGGRWHTAVALEDDTVLFEVKLGPYKKPEAKDFAPGFPAESDPRGSAVLMEWEHLLKRCR